MHVATLSHIPDPWFVPGIQWSTSEVVHEWTSGACAPSHASYSMYTEPFGLPEEVVLLW